jgi:hypothetical protein
MVDNAASQQGLLELGAYVELPPPARTKYKIDPHGFRELRLRLAGWAVSTVSIPARLNISRASTQPATTF